MGRTVRKLKFENWYVVDDLERGKTNCRRELQL